MNVLANVRGKMDTEEMLWRIVLVSLESVEVYRLYRSHFDM